MPFSALTWPVHPHQDVRGGLLERCSHGKHLARAVCELVVHTDVLVDVEQLGCGGELHHHPSCDDGPETEFHEHPTVGGEGRAHPVVMLKIAG